MSKIYNHVYKLKRGKEDVVTNVNPVLQDGEPVVVWLNDGTVNIKVGDGDSPFRELPWVGQEWIINKSTKFDFPNVGKSNVIYKAEDEQRLYQYNKKLHKYQLLGTTGQGGAPSGPITVDDIVNFNEATTHIIETTLNSIEVINGGAL